MFPNKTHEIYDWAVVTTGICIDAVKVHDYAKTTSSQTVGAAVIQYLNNFKLKGTDVENLNFWLFENLNVCSDVHRES